MSRVRTLFVTILPSMITGGLLFGSAPSVASSESTRHPVIVAQADPWTPPRYRSPRSPLPPMPPTPPTYAIPPVPPPPPPLPPHRTHGHGHGMSVSIHDDKIEIDGIEEMVQNQLSRVADALDNLPDVPPDVRDRIKARVDAVRGTLSARLGRLKSLDLDKLDRLGPEVERLGDEIEKEMEGLDKDLAQFGDKFGKHFAEKFGKDFARNFGPGHVPRVYGRDNSDGGDDADAHDDNDDDDDKGAASLPPAADSDLADPDTRDAIAGLKNLTLDPSQRDQLAKLRADVNRQVADARRELEDLSNRLHDTLGDAGASEADIAEQIDQISAKEATIRKARILAWVKARSLLDKDQRKRVEAAAKKHH